VEKVQKTIIDKKKTLRRSKIILEKKELLKRLIRFACESSFFFVRVVELNTEHGIFEAVSNFLS